MARRRSSKNNSTANLGFEAKLWLAVLTPGRYVRAEEVEDDGGPFEEKMKRLTAELEEQFAESSRLERAIRQNLNAFSTFPNESPS